MKKIIIGLLITCLIVGLGIGFLLAGEVLKILNVHLNIIEAPASISLCIDEDCTQNMPDDFSLGDVPAGSDAPFAFYVRNSGIAPITVIAVISESESDISARCEPSSEFTLQPGEALPFVIWIHADASATGRNDVLVQCRFEKVVPAGEYIPSGANTGDPGLDELIQSGICFEPGYKYVRCYECPEGFAFAPCE